MFVRIKGKGIYRYLQLVENHREGKKVVQRVLCTLGRVEHLNESGAIDSLLRSLSRYSQRVKLIDDYRQGRLESRIITNHSGGSRNLESPLVILEESRFTFLPIGTTKNPVVG